jgi:hypothetical protein
VCGFDDSDESDFSECGENNMPSNSNSDCEFGNPPDDKVECPGQIISTLLFRKFQFQISAQRLAVDRG